MPKKGYYCIMCKDAAEASGHGYRNRVPKEQREVRVASLMFRAEHGLPLFEEAS